MSLDGVTHYVSGFAGPLHPRAKVGDHLVTTWHKGIGSKDCEVAVWRDRIKRGDASRCEVHDLSTGNVEVVR